MSKHMPIQVPPIVRDNICVALCPDIFIPKTGLLTRYRRPNIKPKPKEVVDWKKEGF